MTIHPGEHPDRSSFLAVIRKFAHTAPQIEERPVHILDFTWAARAKVVNNGEGSALMQDLRPGAAIRN